MTAVRFKVDEKMSTEVTEVTADITPYYEQGGIAIYHGDCRKVLPKVRGELVLTDPPYGVDLDYDQYEDDAASWYALMFEVVPKMISAAEMVIFPSCQIKRLGFFYKNFNPDWLMAWHKGSPGHVSWVGFNDWEPMIVFGKRKGMPMHDYLSVTNDEKMGNYGHPCPKPIRWARWIINRATAEGETVIDPFMGSGTTLVAAKMDGRKAIGIDVSEAYCEAAANRLAQGVLF